MHLRRVALGTIALALAAPAAPSAVAKTPAKKPPCNAISDDSGDGHTTLGGAIGSPTLDILSADVSTGAKQMTAILRLTSTKVSGDNFANLGERWYLNTTIDGTRYTFWARYSGAPGNTWSGGLTVGLQGAAASPEASFQIVGNTFLWRVDRKAIAPLKKPKRWIYINGASSSISGTNADSAPAKPDTRYQDRAINCLPSK